MVRKLKNFSAILIYIFIAFVFVFQITEHNFNNSPFNEDNVYKNLEALSSEKFNGRLAGSEGNIKALDYVKDYFQSIGVAAGGDNGTYYQNFNTMVPSYNSTPKLSILNKATNEIRNFKYGEDFLDVVNGLGGSGKIQENLYFFGGDIKSVPNNILNSYTIVALTPVTDDDLKYAADNGCKAMLLSVDSLTVKDSFNIHSKSGKSMVIYKISKNATRYLVDNINSSLSATLDLDVYFKAMNTPNILGKIDGTDKSKSYLLITSDIDGVGAIGDAAFVPGSLHSGSGVAMMLELARTMKSSKLKPQMTVIFAAFNSHEEGNLGSKYYVENPIYPLHNSQVLSLDALGSAKDKKLYLSSFGSTGEALMGKLATYISKDDISIISKRSVTGGDTEVFLKKDVPAVLVYGDSTYDISNSSNSINTTLGSSAQIQEIYHSTSDNMDNIDKERISHIGNTVTNYLQREVYHDWFHGVFNNVEITIIIALSALTFICIVIKTLSKAKPSGSLLGISYFGIYHSNIFKIADKLTKLTSAFFIVIFIIVFIAFIPPSFNVIVFNKTLIPNYSVFIIGNNAVKYMTNFVTEGFGETLEHFKILTIILFSIGKSMLLIVSSLLLAFIVGTLTGTITGFSKNRNARFGVLLSIALMSLPDVLIALVFQLIRVFIYKHDLLSLKGEGQSFLFSFLCLAIIPTAYIVRMAQTATSEEIQKNYIAAAKAKGLSNFKIIINHLLKAVSIKVVEALPSVLNIIISNLIIIEYFFNYHGIVYQIFSSYKDGDIHATIGLVIGMGAVYCILSMLIKAFSLFNKDVQLPS
jgi:ABC-type dipeptide/oligopeptide/nickel transport system permease component